MKPLVLVLLVIMGAPMTAMDMEMRAVTLHVTNESTQKALVLSLHKHKDGDEPYLIIFWGSGLSNSCAVDHLPVAKYGSITCDAEGVRGFFKTFVTLATFSDDILYEGPCIGRIYRDRGKCKVSLRIMQAEEKFNVHDPTICERYS